MKKYLTQLTFLSFLLLFCLTPVYAQGETYHVKYSSHVENKGWSDYLFDGETAGSTGEGLRLEALKIFITNDKGDLTSNIGIKYRSHVQDLGWENFHTNGQTSGTTGQSKKIEAIQLSLIGPDSEQYDLFYRSHIENFGWLSWTKNGEPSGSEGLNARLEAFEIKIIPKNSSESPEEGEAFKSVYGNGNLYYHPHVENLGWLNYYSDGEVAGTTGQNLKLEALTLSLNPSLPEGDIECSAHVQDKGWLDYKKAGSLIGTTGENKRLEALKIRLTGDLEKNYDVCYQVHVQDKGWLDPVINDNIAGTTGESKKIEAIKIQLLKKGTPIPDQPKECKHISTEIRNKVDPTCQIEGNTGDTYCLDCGEKIASGQLIPKVDHSYQEQIITPASKNGKGKSRFICKYCNTTYEIEPDFNPTPEQVYQDIIALKSQYREDMPWTNANTYTSTALNQVGGGCHAFALICSDTAFGYLPGRKHNDPNQIKVGDLLRIHNDNHTVVVLEVHPDYVIITEGNYNSDIHWGRKILRQDLDSDITYILTRYP